VLIGAAALIAVVAGAAAFLLVTRPGSGQGGAAVTPTPAASPTPSGAPPIVTADCVGTAPDGYAAAADRAVCSVMTPLAALDGACTGTPGTACAGAARQLSQAAGNALQRVEAQTPSTAGERAADPHLRAALRDYAGAGSDIAAGVSGAKPSRVTAGMNELTAATGALSAAGTALSG
jgi:hypothetical protein